MIPYYVFALAYLVAVIICFGFFAINMFLLGKFGFFDFTSQIQTAMVLAVILIIIVFTGIFLHNTDWFSDIDILDSLNLPTSQSL